jgi:DNA-binding NtrC family response regulator
MRKLLLASNNDGDLAAVYAFFSRDYQLLSVPAPEEFLDALGEQHPDLAFIDVRLLGSDPDSFPAFLGRCRERSAGTPVFVLCPADMTEMGVAAVQAGASDYLTWPLSTAAVDHVAATVREQQRLRQELAYWREGAWRGEAVEMVRTRSPAMQAIYNKVLRAAPTRTTVLLTGETGVGKGALARIIHQHSNRDQGPFICVNCGSIPDNLVESELFGHEKGAFTGAVRRKLGQFEIAQGGTILLDEVGSISMATQVKLLGVLQDRVMQRVGGEANIKVDVRVIAATNVDLEQACREGRFRRDLYYRLNVFPIRLPPLRERTEDIEIICATILNRLAGQGYGPFRGLAEDVLDAFRRYEWPGNVRELENLLERAAILENADVLTRDSFPAEIFGDDGAQEGFAIDTRWTLAEARARCVEEVERAYLRKVLAEHGGRINRTAQAAGVSTRQLHKMMTRYGLRKEDFKCGA